MPPRAIPWLAWGGAACGCVIVLALGMVLGTTWLTARSAAQHLVRPAAGVPAVRPLEADIEVVSAEGQLAPGAAAATCQFTVRLRNKGTAAVLVQRVNVTLLDATGREVGHGALRNLVVVPGPPAAFHGAAALDPGRRVEAVRVRAEIVPTR